MTTDALDPVIHAPARLQIVATLAALPQGDALRLTRLQPMLHVTPGHLTRDLRELEDAGYLACASTGDGGAQTAVALTRQGRDMLDRYAAMLRNALAVPATQYRTAPAPEIRVGDADREATAAALSEHFAQGRLTLDELNARLEVALAATTHGALSEATADLPEVTMISARVSFSRGKRRPGHLPGRQRHPQRGRSS